MGTEIFVNIFWRSLLNWIFLWVIAKYQLLLPVFVTKSVIKQDGEVCLPFRNNFRLR